VVTCTRATMAAGAAPTITITVTAAQVATVAASTTVAVTAANASTANDTEATQLNFVTRDATSGIYYPATTTEVTNFVSYNALTIDVPTSIYTCQEASGNLADTGAGGITLVANGTPLYQQAVSGHARKAVGFNAGVNQRFMAASGTAPNPATTSSLWGVIGAITATPAATSQWIQASDTAHQSRATRRSRPAPTV
jgi:hypothetical protein